MLKTHFIRYLYYLSTLHPTLSNDGKGNQTWSEDKRKKIASSLKTLHEIYVFVHNIMMRYISF